MAKIVLKDLWKKYGGTVEAVKGINLTIEDGEFFSFLGPSGCGKTSTMRMIAGLEDITSGTITFNGNVVNDLPPAQRDVAMAFETYALYPPLTVRENLAFPLQAQRLPAAEINERVEEIARILDLTDVLEKRPGETSGGHQQRISLGRCLIRRPNVYLFDEPLSHVDSDARRRMRGEIKRLQQLFSTTSIYVTHDQLEAVALADRIAVINFGEIQQVGTPEEIYHHPANIFVGGFIGEPPFNFLKAKIVSENGDLGFLAADACRSVPVPDRLKAVIQKRTDENVILGIRPMYLTPKLSDRDDCHIQGSVYVFEYLGETGVLTVQAKDDLIRVVTSADFPGKPGDPVGLSIDVARMHAFDPQSEKNLLVG